ncbi:AraC family transcriptional regulator [Parahaliea maris]|uniref:AraC family transcriptional regulator n=1 Tax=Parahaliea maris TaxID=2716870 RepID=A0A5C9A691_9GAMM|nr:helix-turn-helix domain-containing protein [Parahaliea maris]TXS95290.1 AraC family transcriptional regulator [Parahaliea maris]
MAKPEIPAQRPEILLPLSDLEPLQAKLAEDGLSLADIFFELGIGERGILPERIRFSDYYRALGLLSKTTGDEIYHLSSRPFLRGANDFITSSAVGVDNLFEAMKAISKSTNLLYGGEFDYVERHGSKIIFIIEDAHFPFKFDDANFNYLTMECAIIYVVAMLVYLSDGAALQYLKKFKCTRPRFDPERNFLSCLDVPLVHGSNRYEMHFDAKVMALPVVESVRSVNVSKKVALTVIDMIEGRVGGTPGADSIPERVLKVMEDGVYEQTVIAERLHVSVATLKRHLMDSNTTFRELRDTSLFVRAKAMLALKYHPNEVAEKLGYSDFRSFYRAFKRWSGVTPHTYVSKHRQREE